jgi:peptide/nickel transport system substrate-binding protein
MGRSVRWASMLGMVTALALAGAACGGDEGGGGGGGDEQSTSTGAPVKGKQGGKLTVLWSDDVDYIDAGRSYYQMGYAVSSATQKPLYSYKPDNGEKMVPDLADGEPQISKDGKTVTVKIKKGVKFSPPVDREVTSKDVKYAIERGFFSSVNTGYAQPYFGDIEGAKVGAEPGTKIPGIETPDDQTLVLKLKTPTGGVYAAGALGQMMTAPVPEEYARKFDKGSDSTYGANQVATGPYMIRNDAKGKAIGYEPGRRIQLVRNPNWDKNLDFKPAYLDEIDMPQGNDDTTVASRKIITGQSMVNGDIVPPPPIIKQTVTEQKDQLALISSGSQRYVSMNTQLKPFDDVNLRKAAIAGFDRDAMRLVRGGKLLGEIPTHFIPPGMAGYEEAGGAKGPGLDFMSKPAGDANLATEYFKKAGMSSGKYEGKDEVLMVGTAEGVDQKTAEVAKENFEKLGFKVRLRLVAKDAMYTKYCNRPAADVAICPNVAWSKDFSDAQTILDPTFNGGNIVPENNSNWPQLDDPKIDQAMDKAKESISPEDRAKAWAEADKMITEQAPAVNWIWDKTPLVASKNVNAVASQYNGQWDVAWTSLK